MSVARDSIFVVAPSSPRQWAQYRGEMFLVVAGLLAFVLFPQNLGLLTNMAADISFSLEYLGKSEELDFLAYHDLLTGLPNRARYLERLDAALREARQKKSRVAVVFGDIRRFRYVNDTFGRRAGDALLCELSGRLRRAWPRK